ncbi:MAG: efflux RND transporter periplasmic adaptor subunit [Bacteroidaceae bacterium]|nr:efflux RND transporter periplasmic adaptor subunit [Bacteroidaceae bacterium]
MEKNRKYLSIAFVAILAAVVLITVVGMVTAKKPPLTLQGEVEATEIRISGKLLGRVDSFLVREGDDVRQGQELVVINSPIVEAQYRKSEALHRAAKEENRKLDAGTRRQIVESSYQLWQSARSQAELAEKTYRRVLTLYRDSVVARQRYDEAEAAMRSTAAAERAAYEQYLLATEGAQREDRVAGQSMVEVAASGVDEVAALLVDARLTAPADGQIAAIFPKRGELVAPGAPIMNLVVIDDCYVVFNIREDLMPHFRMGGHFTVSIPALGRTDVALEVYYISPLGSFATWKSTKEAGSYDMRTFEVKLRPLQPVDGLRPGMTAILRIKN